MNVVRIIAHIPFELFKLPPHLRLGLAEVAGRGRQDPAIQAHLFATGAWLMRLLGLFHIAANLLS